MEPVSTVVVSRAQAGQRRPNPQSSGAFQGSFSECKEQQLVFLLVRQLATAQFELANPAMTRRLWQEVAALEIDPERITSLLYGGHDINDTATLRLLDDQWRSCHRRQRRSWFSRVTAPVAWPRNAAPAAPQAHPPAR